MSDEYDEPLFFRVMAYAAEADRDVVDMVSGNPDWGSPPGIAAGLHEYADLGGEAFQYPPSDGLVELREEVAERRNVDPRTTLDPAFAIFFTRIGLYPSEHEWLYSGWTTSGPTTSGTSAGKGPRWAS